MSHDDCDIVLREVQAELAAAILRAETVEAQRDEWHRQNGILRGERDQARAELDRHRSQLAEWADLKQACGDVREMRDRAARTERAEAEVEQLRAQLGETSVEWGVRYEHTTDDGIVITTIDEGFDDEADARDSADDGDTVLHRLVGQWRGAEPDAVACCVCGSADVVYRNYQDKPFCAPCANGMPGPVKAPTADATHLGADPGNGCLCPHSGTPDGTLVRDGVLALGCPVHDPDAADAGQESDR